MDVLQINYFDFLMQALGLAAWVWIVGALYAIAERAIEGKQQ